MIGFRFDNHKRLKIGIGVGHANAEAKRTHLDCTFKEREIANKHSPTQRDQRFASLILSFIEGRRVHAYDAQL